jgi:hypothetical protein
MSGAAAGGKGGRLDNYKLYRPEAVRAYALRRAGEPWAARLPGEAWMVLGLTLLATLACAVVVAAGRI